MWLNGDRDADYTGESASQVKVVNNGADVYTATDTAWTLAAGNSNTANMCADADTQLLTPWHATGNVMYSYNDANNSVNGTSDFVWVGMSLDIPTDATNQSATGTIAIYFKSGAD